MSDPHDTEEPTISRAERFENSVEIPMLILSLLILPVVIMPYVERLSEPSRRALNVLGVVIWVAFGLQYLVLLYLSDDKWHTVRTHKLDLLLVALPFLRPLRLIRIVRLAQAGVGFTKVARAFRRLALRPGFITTVGTVAGMILMGGALVAIAENEQPNSTIGSIADGLWWALVTCTTVGYGDEFPVTGTGRFIAIVLMLGGISGLSVITANVAAYFVGADEQDDDDETMVRLERIESQLRELTQQLSNDGRSTGGMADGTV